MKNKTVLVVEDEPGLAFIFSEVLAAEGVLTHLAGNGREALQVLEIIQPKLDLILCDLSMPIMGGLDFIQAGLQKYGHMPVVMLTANSDSDTIRQCMNLGAIDFVTKPFDLDLLRQKLPAWIDQAKLKKTA
jgi:two-component system response regulator (stage 0 sporulation protein F)